MDTEVQTEVQRVKLPIYKIDSVIGLIQAITIAENSLLEENRLFNPSILLGCTMGAKVQFLEKQAEYGETNPTEFRFFIVQKGLLSVAYDGKEYEIQEKEVFLLKRGISFMIKALEKSELIITHMTPTVIESSAA